jgi:hypothetical protein
MLQEASYGSALPDGLAGGSRTRVGHAPLRQAIQTAAGGAVAGKDCLDPDALSRLDPHAGGIARMLQAEALALRGNRPRQPEARLECMQSPAPHALGDEGAFVLRHRATHLQEQVVMRILTHGPVQELTPAASALDLFQEHHLVDVVRGQVIGSGEQHQVTAGCGHRIAHGIQSGSAQGSTTAAFVTKDEGVVHRFAVLSTPRAHALAVLLTGLLVGLSLRRDPTLPGDAHGLPPGRRPLATTPGAGGTC